MFSETHFSNEENLRKALELVLHSLLNPQEQMPVKVEAAMALQILLNDQPRLEKLIEPQIKDIILSIWGKICIKISQIFCTFFFPALVKLIRETENDDLTNVVQRLIGVYTLQVTPIAVQIAQELRFTFFFIGVYTLQVTPIAVQIAQELAQIFTQLLENDDGAEDRAITAVGVLNTLEVIMDAVEEFPQITNNLEEVVIYVINTIINKEAMEFFDEAFILVASLIVKQISDRCWPLLDMAAIRFDVRHMMPSLHSFLTVDPEKFICQPSRLEMIFDMCRMILSEDIDDDTQCHAAKLLEVLILQFKNRIDPVIRPICEIVLARLVKEIKSSELRTMCLQVLIAALHYNPQLFIQILQTFQSPDASMPLLDLFVKQWLCDTDCFLGLHDRKMCLIGLTTLIAMPDRPKVLFEMSQNLLPSCLTLYQGLQKAYE
uniref:Importin-7/11-like TPR repeats domain-containing protein n=1 Tax=Romanomermis culicivorax TaxID=13658 RepID=A0A915IJW3_ROMCU